MLALKIALIGFKAVDANLSVILELVYALQQTGSVIPINAIAVLVPTTVQIAIAFGMISSLL